MHSTTAVHQHVADCASMIWAMPLRSLQVGCIAFVILMAGPGFAERQAPRPAPDHVSSLHITILSTMLADEGFGEWGFAALVEVDGRRLLFDTGANEDTVAPI
jgi:hypothetical protein